MAFQTWQQHQFSSHLTITNRESVNNQAGAAMFNNPVQMGTESPFATTMESHMLLGSNNLVIQEQTNAVTSTHTGPVVTRKRRPRVSTANQANSSYMNNHVQYCSSLESIKNDMIALSETDHKLSQQRKKVKMELAKKQNQVVEHLLKQTKQKDELLKEKDEKIANIWKVNIEFQEKVNNISHLKQTWKDYATDCEMKVMSLRNELDVVTAEVNRLQGLVQSSGSVASSSKEKPDLKSLHGSNIYGKNTQSNAQGRIRVKVEEAGETAAEIGEGSGENKVCKRCGQFEMTFMGQPCSHLCYCPVCGTYEYDDLVRGPCAGCESIMNATTAAATFM